MSCNTCICPEVDCGPVLTCIKEDLAKVHINSDPVLDNFCAAVSTCVDAQFLNIASGLSTDYDYFGLAIAQILKSFSGYSGTGDWFFQVADGQLQWTSGSVGQTYLANGTGITVSGNGSSGTPYKPNLSTAYVQGLFSASNGLTYTSGNTVLGGTLLSNTTVSGDNTYDLNLINLGDFVLESLGDTYLQIADYSAASSGDVLTLVDAVTGEVGWATPSTFSGNFIQNQLVGPQSATFIISGFAKVGGRFFAGDTSLVSDISHLFRGVDSDLIPLAVTDSSGTTLFRVYNSFVSVGTRSSDPINPAADNGIYFNSTSNVLRFYDSTRGWHNKTPESRLISTEHSLTGGGNLSADRTLSLVNDTANPGNSKYYGTDSSGTRGWYDLGTGTVTSVDLVAPSILTVSGGPVSTSGTLALDLATQSANTIFAGPTSGANAQPTFRALVANDIPDNVLSVHKLEQISSKTILGRSTVGTGNVQVLTLGSHLDILGGVLNTYGRTIIDIQRFTTNGVWMKPTGCNAVIVEVIGAGGGGGGVSGSSSNAAAAGGGGGGAFSVNYITGGLGSTEAVVVGSGGAGGAAGNNTGSTGGDSSFGSHITATGGEGGSGMAFGTSEGVAAGGISGVITATKGTILASGGEAGSLGVRLSGTVGFSGTGGSSYHNGAPAGNVTSSLGTAGNARGVGGSGAFSADGNDYPGGPGQDGLVIVYALS